MTLEQYASLAEVVGVALVIASLIYVAKQLRQNTEAIQAQSRQAVLSAAQSELFAEMDHPEVVISIVKKGELTPEEHVKLASWFFALFRAREFAWLQFRNGVIDADQWNTEAAAIRGFLDSRRTRDWWTAIGRTFFSGEYVQFVDSLMNDTPPSDTLWQKVANWTSP